jgi:predicted AlkP superfamily pyrophosphatase or phosphodiesterase
MRFRHEVPSIRLALVLLLALVLPAASLLAAPLARHVVIISLDGLRPDAITPETMPVVERLKARGAYTPEARTTLPSVTLVCHASMLTGVGPDMHGVTWNSEKPKGTMKVPTIFMLAAERGLSTALVTAKMRLSHLVPDRKVTRFVKAGWTSATVAKAASKLIEEEQPALMLVHLIDPDSAGHKDGFMSEGYLKAATATDRAVAQVLAAISEAGLEANTLVIVTADHGGKTGAKRHGSSHPQDVLIPWLAVGPGVREGLRLRHPVSIVDTAATALWALGVELPAHLTGKPVMEAFATSPSSSSAR